MTPGRDLSGTLYRTLLVYVAVAVVILTAGVAEFVYFERPGYSTGATAHIQGIYHYDPHTDLTSGADRSIFARDEQLAAVVDWASLPDNLTVDARWVNSFGTAVGGVGPASPQELAGKSIVPVKVPAGLHLNLPGQYIFVVERFHNGLPVEVLARRLVLVER